VQEEWIRDAQRKVGTPKGALRCDVVVYIITAIGRFALLDQPFARF
jgi:hypothetical protein